MISLSEILHTIAQALLIPCLIILIVLMAGAVWQIGDIVVEYIAERRKHKCEVPQLLRDVHTAGADGLADLIENSGLLRRQKKALLELAESRNLPKDTLTALAERLLATEEARNARTTSVTDMIAKLGPMFGLLGTLIPLGPGIVALGQGDTVTLSESMNVAFDTTIAGVISAAVASVISHIRKRWYNDDKRLASEPTLCLLTSARSADSLRRFSAESKMAPVGQGFTEVGVIVPAMADFTGLSTRLMKIWRKYE